MNELVQNVGEFEGEKVQKQLCDHAYIRVLVWPACTPFKNRITKHKYANLHGNSHGKSLTVCKIIINFVHPTVHTTECQIFEHDRFIRNPPYAPLPPAK